MDINKLFGAVIAIVIGVILVPVIADVAFNVTHEYNASAVEYQPIADLPTGVASLVDLLPLVFVIIIVAGAIAWIRLRN